MDFPYEFSRINWKAVVQLCPLNFHRQTEFYGKKEFLHHMHSDSLAIAYFHYYFAFNFFSRYLFFFVIQFLRFITWSQHVRAHGEKKKFA
jgi:hypothetical protein